MKRQEAITFLKQLQYFILKLTGVAEMKAGTIDVSCKTRKDVIELYDNLQKVYAVAFMKLYEQDMVNVVVGWVPIPMPNERIKSAYQNLRNFLPVRLHIYVNAAVNLNMTWIWVQRKCTNLIASETTL